MRWAINFIFLNIITIKAFYFKVNHQTAQITLADYENSDFTLETGDISFFSGGKFYKQSTNNLTIIENGAFAGDDILGQGNSE